MSSFFFLSEMSQIQISSGRLDCFVSFLVHKNLDRFCYFLANLYKIGIMGIFFSNIFHWQDYCSFISFIVSRLYCEVSRERAKDMSKLPQGQIILSLGLGTGCSLFLWHFSLLSLSKPTLILLLGLSLPLFFPVSVSLPLFFPGSGHFFVFL